MRGTAICPGCAQEIATAQSSAGTVGKIRFEKKAVMELIVRILYECGVEVYF